MRSREYAIKDYAIIGNCETAALINSEGGIDWLCLPAFDAPSFLGALLDREKGGQFVIRPVNECRIEREYIGDSAVLRTRFVTAQSTILLSDFFVIARQRHARFYDFTSLHPTQKLVRLIQLETGTAAEVELRLSARPNYGRQQPLWKERAEGFVCVETSLFSNLPLTPIGDDICGRAVLEPGKARFVVLDYSPDAAAPNLAAVERWFEITKAFWEEWNLFNYYRGPHRDAVRRSAVTLKLLTYAPTGAFVAAPTTSLPEKIGGDGNWDYRFSWLRDTSLFINTLFRIGYSGEAKAYLNFICKKFGDSPETTAKNLPALFPIRDETHIEQEELDHLAGFRDSRPVRRGNHAVSQFQLDNYGHLLQSFFFWRQTGGELDARKKRIAAAVVEAAAERWGEPDNGIWEKAEAKQHTFAKVSAWLTLQRGRDLGLIEPGRAEHICEQIRRDLYARGVQEKNGNQVLTDTFDDERLDCSALLAFTTGFLRADIARNTRRQIEQRLAASPWLYRSELYRATGEGAFVLCSYWWIEHLLREGEPARANDLLEQLIARCSPLGLYSEEIDPASGEFLGNFPQAFSHLGLIAAVLNLHEAKKDPQFASLPDHEKFCRSVGPTVGVRGVVAGFFRVPSTVRLLVSRRAKWRE